MTFTVDIFHFNCKSKSKQIKWIKIKVDMCKSDRMFLYLQSSILFKWTLKFISWESLSQKWMIAVSKETCSSFNFIP